MRTIVRLSVLGLAFAGVIRASGVAEANVAGPCNGWKVTWIAAASTDGTGRDGGFLVTEGPAKAVWPPESRTGAQGFVPWHTHWRSIACGYGRIVGVNCDGQLYTTTDGLSWRRRESGTPSSLHGVAFGNGRFAAVGNEGAIVTSTDAVIWRGVDAGTDERFRGVAFGNGRFVAVGYAGTILTSPDGGRWTPRPSGTDVRLQGIAYGNGTFVAVGWQGVVLTSPTGTDWTRRSLGTAGCLNQITFVECRSLTNAKVLSVRTPSYPGERLGAAQAGMGPPRTLTATNRWWGAAP